MILIDSSVWMDHFRNKDLGVQHLLQKEQVLMHPFVLGELAMGNLQPRDTILNDLGDLALVTAATDEEVLSFISRHGLFGIGIGYIDAHLLAAVQLTPDARLWTRDKRLQVAAEKLNLAMRPS